MVSRLSNRFSMGFQDPNKVWSLGCASLSLLGATIVLASSVKIVTRTMLCYSCCLSHYDLIGYSDAKEAEGMQEPQAHMRSLRPRVRPSWPPRPGPRGRVRGCEWNAAEEARGLDSAEEQDGCS